MTINSANDDQISFIIDLMHRYDEDKLIDIETMKDEFFYSTVLTKAKEVFLDTKNNSKNRISNFLPEKFREHFKQRKGCLTKCNESIQWQK